MSLSQPQEPHRHGRRTHRCTAKAGKHRFELEAPIESVAEFGAERPPVVGLLHDLHKLVLETPGCGVGNAKVTFEFQGSDAALLLGGEIHRLKPRSQWQFGVGKNGIGGQ